MNSKIKLENKVILKRLDIQHSQLNKLLNSKLAEINNLIAQMYTAQAVIHDIATPLTLLKNEIKKKDVNITSLIANIKQITKLVDEYKSTKYKDTKHKTASLKTHLKQCQKIALNSYTDVRIKTICESDAFVTISTVKLRQIILNLIANSAQQCVLGTQIRINAFKTPTYTKIIYKDNAGGIPKSIYKDVFKPFYTNKNYKTNSGLGLYNCKKIIEKEYLGNIKCITKHGKGTIFYIKFPRNELNNRV